ncbi:hypothetical protein TRVL_09688 [Trypanosoma vivax]|nr:hypothetical protein TRVL_09688 [Trypanosoma vivax]
MRSDRPCPCLVRSCRRQIWRRSIPRVGCGSKTVESLQGAAQAARTRDLMATIIMTITTGVFRTSTFVLCTRQLNICHLQCSGAPCCPAEVRKINGSRTAAVEQPVPHGERGSGLKTRWWRNEYGHKSK